MKLFVAESKPAKYVRFTVLSTNQAEPCIDELEIWSAAGARRPPVNVALSSGGARATSSGDYSGNPFHKLEHIHDGIYGNERSWISNESGRGWVEIELVDESGQPVPGETYEIIGPDGTTVRRGSLNSNGQASVILPTEGGCQICLTNPDADAWERVGRLKAIDDLNGEV